MGIWSVSYTHLDVYKRQVQSVSQTIDIYVLKWGISQGNYALGTAAGIFKSFVSIILIVIANQIAKKNGEERLF